MFHLEDYLEEIEQVPAEIIHGLTQIRELDLSVQNTMDVLKLQTSEFFLKTGTITDQDHSTEFQDILKKYNKAVDESAEKINLAKEMSELVNRCIRKLKHEMGKFKVELEADNPGITELIERRVDEQENEPKSDIESAFMSVEHMLRRGSRRHLSYENPLHAEFFKSDSVNTEISECIEEPKYSTELVNNVPSPQPAFVIEHTSAGGAAIAAAASQAIVATQQMQQGRRTASLKASFEAINSVGIVNTQLPKTLTNDSIINKELAGAAQVAIAAIQETTKKRQRGRARKNVPSSVDSGSSTSSSLIANADALDEDITDLDGNEERYCHCNEVAFGDMVACDNKSCPFEWYHYGCVGVTEPPKGKWYCPQCIITMKKRAGRKSHI